MMKMLSCWEMGQTDKFVQDAHSDLVVAVFGDNDN